MLLFSLKLFAYLLSLFAFVNAKLAALLDVVQLSLSLQDFLKLN